MGNDTLPWLRMHRPKLEHKLFGRGMSGSEPLKKQEASVCLCQFFLIFFLQAPFQASSIHEQRKLTSLVLFNKKAVNLAKIHDQTNKISRVRLMDLPYTRALASTSADPFCDIAEAALR
jgi:hypothetical protein